METRLIEPGEAEALRALRIRAVTEHASAFGTSVEEEAAVSMEQIADELREGPLNSYWRGVFDAATLIGILHLFQFQRPKLHHKTMLGGMYIVPDYRGRGIGRVLLEDTIAFAKTLANVELITLAVTVGNDAARKLYIRSGFIPFGIEPRYIRVDQTYYDIEWMIFDLAKRA